MLPWVLAGFAGLSALAAASSLVFVRTKLGIDKATLDKMRREQAEENKRADQARRDEDDRRDRERNAADDRRNSVLRDELDTLSRRSNARFEQWQEAVADLDELWTSVEDDLLPWMREAYARLCERGIEMPRPPTPRRRRGLPLPEETHR